MAYDLLDQLVEVTGRPVRVLLAGPAGVGKTTLAREVSGRYQSIKHIDHDAMKNWANETCPCRPAFFDPDRCFGKVIASAEEFVIDIGAGTVFRELTENPGKLEKMLVFKRAYSLKIVTLLAGEATVRERFLCKQGTSPTDFEVAWHEWLAECQWWSKCHDYELWIGKQLSHEFQGHNT